MDSTHWNDRYATAEYVWKADPNIFLAAESHRCPRRAGPRPGLRRGPQRRLARRAGLDRHRRRLLRRRPRQGPPPGRRPRRRGRPGCAPMPPPGTHPTTATTSSPSSTCNSPPTSAAEPSPSPAGRSRPAAPCSSSPTTAPTSPTAPADPQNPAVLYRPDDVLADLEAAGIDVTVERAETVERPVAGADRPALDCLVRARTIARRSWPLISEAGQLILLDDSASDQLSAAVPPWCGDRAGRGRAATLRATTKTPRVRPAASQPPSSFPLTVATARPTRNAGPADGSIPQTFTGDQPFVVARAPNQERFARRGFALRAVCRGLAPLGGRHIAEHLLDMPPTSGVRRTMTSGALRSSTHTPQGI